MNGFSGLSQEMKHMLRQPILESMASDLPKWHNMNSRDAARPNYALRTRPNYGFTHTCSGDKG